MSKKNMKLWKYSIYFLIYFFFNFNQSFGQTISNLDIDNLPGVDINDDARMLSKIPDESCDIIYACHILEHLGRHEIENVLKTWNKKLKKNGIIRLAVPDFQKAIQWYQKNPDLEDILGLIIGGQKTKYDFH